MSWVEKDRWRKKAAWEEFWIDYAQSGKKDIRVDESYFPATPLLGYGFAREAFLAGLREQRRILFVGNGINREPLSYYFSGFDVTVVDISEKACEIFGEIAKKVSNRVSSFLSNALESKIDYSGSPIRNEGKIGQFVYRPGGNLEIISADMFEWQPKTKWHYINNKLAFLAFTEEERELLLSRYYSWLEKSGQLQICYYYAPGHPFKQIAEMGKKIGFLVKDDDIADFLKKTSSYRDNPSEYKKLWLEYEYSEHEKELLVREGAKMLLVIWGSGL